MSGTKRDKHAKYSQELLDAQEHKNFNPFTLFTLQTPQHNHQHHHNHNNNNNNNNSNNNSSFTFSPKHNNKQQQQQSAPSLNFNTSSTTNNNSNKNLTTTTTNNNNNNPVASTMSSASSFPQLSPFEDELDDHDNTYHYLVEDEVVAQNEEKQVQKLLKKSRLNMSNSIPLDIQLKLNSLHHQQYMNDNSHCSMNDLHTYRKKKSFILLETLSARNPHNPLSRSASSRTVEHAASHTSLTSRTHAQSNNNLMPHAPSSPAILQPLLYNKISYPHTSSSASLLSSSSSSKLLHSSSSATSFGTQLRDLSHDFSRANNDDLSVATSTFDNKKSQVTYKHTKLSHHDKILNKLHNINFSTPSPTTYLPNVTAFNNKHTLVNLDSNTQRFNDTPLLHSSSQKSDIGPGSYQVEKQIAPIKRLSSMLKLDVEINKYSHLLNERSKQLSAMQSSPSCTTYHVNDPSKTLALSSAKYILPQPRLKVVESTPAPGYTQDVYQTKKALEGLVPFGSSTPRMPIHAMNNASNMYIKPRQNSSYIPMPSITKHDQQIIKEYENATMSLSMAPTLPNASAPSGTHAAIHTKLVTLQQPHIQPRYLMPKEILQDLNARTEWLKQRAKLQKQHRSEIYKNAQQKKVEQRERLLLIQKRHVKILSRSIMKVAQQRWFVLLVHAWVIQRYQRAREESMSYIQRLQATLIFQYHWRNRQMRRDHQLRFHALIQALRRVWLIFVVGHRIRKKRNAICLIQRFWNDYVQKQGSRKLLNIVGSFKSKVLTIQRYMRNGYLKHRSALNVALAQWELYDSKHSHIKENVTADLKRQKQQEMDELHMNTNMNTNNHNNKNNHHKKTSFLQHTTSSSQASQQSQLQQHQQQQQQQQYHGSTHAHDIDDDNNTTTTTSSSTTELHHASSTSSTAGVVAPPAATTVSPPQKQARDRKKKSIYGEQVHHGIIVAAGNKVKIQNIFETRTHVHENTGSDNTRLIELNVHVTHALKRRVLLETLKIKRWRHYKDTLQYYENLSAFLQYKESQQSSIELARLLLTGDLDKLRHDRDLFFQKYPAPFIHATIAPSEMKELITQTYYLQHEIDEQIKTFKQQQQQQQALQAQNRQMDLGMKNVSLGSLNFQNSSVTAHYLLNSSIALPSPSHAHVFNNHQIRASSLFSPKYSPQLPPDSEADPYDYRSIHALRPALAQLALHRTRDYIAQLSIKQIEQEGLYMKYSKHPHLHDPHAHAHPHSHMRGMSSVTLSIPGQGSSNNNHGATNSSATHHSSHSVSRMKSNEILRRQSSIDSTSSRSYDNTTNSSHHQSLSHSHSHTSGRNSPLSFAPITITIPSTDSAAIITMPAHLPSPHHHAPLQIMVTPSSTSNSPSAASSHHHHASHKQRHHNKSSSTSSVTSVSSTQSEQSPTSLVTSILHAHQESTSVSSGVNYEDALQQRENERLQRELAKEKAKKKNKNSISITLTSPTSALSPRTFKPLSPIASSPASPASPQSPRFPPSSSPRQHKLMSPTSPNNKMKNPYALPYQSPSKIVHNKTPSDELS